MMRRRGLRGMSLIEVAMALCLLSLTAVFLIGAITVLTRRDVKRVDNLAQANALATRYLETQRTNIRGSSLLVVTPHPVDEQAIAGTIFTADVTQELGTVAGGSFVSDPSGTPGAASVVRVTVTITWTENGTERQVLRQDILAPRKV